MADIFHHISINAAAHLVYRGLTSENGIKCWWTEDCVVIPELGSIAEFGFYEYDMILRMRIDELLPPQRLSWTCIGGPEEWDNTTLAFDLVPHGDDGTTLIFRHAGCKFPKERFAGYNKYWSAALVRLKAFAEGRPIGALHAAEDKHISVPSS